MLRGNTNPVAPDSFTEAETSHDGGSLVLSKFLVLKLSDIAVVLMLTRRKDSEGTNSGLGDEIASVWPASNDAAVCERQGKTPGFLRQNKGSTG